MIRLDFKEYIYYFFLVIVFVFIFSLLFMPYEVKAETFNPNFVRINLNYGANTVNYNSKTEFGSYTRYIFPNFYNQAPWSIGFGFNYDFPINSKYYYVYGFSNYSMTTAYSDQAGYCENIANSSSDFSTNAAGDVQGLIPFGFKCQLTSKKDYYLNISGTGITPETIEYSPIVFLKNIFFYDVDSSNSTVESYIKQDMQYSKEQIQKQEETNQAIKDTNDTLKDGSTDDPSNSFNSYNDKLAQNGVITNLITLPIRLFTNILNSINGTCTTFTLGNLMGTNLTFPCINVANYLGSTIWNVIDILISGLFVRSIAKKMIKVFENFSSMREGDVLGD